MDFGDILDSWENKAEKTDSSRENLENWMDKHGIQDKDTQTVHHVKNKQEKIQTRSILRSMKPEAQIDLHGMKKDEALLELERFLLDSGRKGLKKVLIIHGKGVHSQQGPVLKNAVRNFLEGFSAAGETGTADKNYGGNGALWVILR